MLNNVILEGRLTDEPVIRQTKSGRAVCIFTVAVRRNIRSKKYSENVGTDFLRVRAWENTADFVSRYFRKGQLIQVIGKLRSDKWKDSDGKIHYETFVLANETAFAPANKFEKPAPQDEPPMSADPIDLSDFEEIADNVTLPF